MLRSIAAALLAAPLLVCAQDAAKDAPKPAAKPAAKAPAKAGAQTAVAHVNGIAVPASRMEFMMEQQRSRGAPDNQQARTMMREELVNREVVAQEAQKSGLAKSSEVATQMDIARQEILVGAYLRDWAKKHPVSDAEIQQEYDKARAQTGDKEYRARHILVENEDQAKAVITDLNNGAKFDELAKKSSKDAGSKDRGGDLDWNVPSAFDKQFSDAMMKLDKGKYTATPVQTRFGYHIIQLDDVRPVRFPGIEEVKGRIQQQIQQHKVDELVQGLRAKAKVE